jgi:hypothetical protein
VPEPVSESWCRMTVPVYHQLHRRQIFVYCELQCRLEMDLLKTRMTGGWNGGCVHKNANAPEGLLRPTYFQILGVGKILVEAEGTM